ncbi:hypothetical protein [Pinibacter aurantiacus]|uniref:Uncharacterized protein n=1 Tax=Pinibacter aurantiacus TaxID=2851599 RepID=A0A9E2SD39_9BACT|nr:hypothetical protein [Pinibacter aurantiacus]MBV4359083.1 hypothetical protein [Pinibacter aurantiacus]
MAQLNLQQQITLRKALRSELINIEGIARKAILKKDLVIDFVSGKPSLNSMQLTALQQTVISLFAETKTILSELERQQTLSEKALESLQSFVSKFEISLESLLNEDADALSKIQKWTSGQETFPLKLTPIIKRGLLKLAGDIAQ